MVNIPIMDLVKIIKILSSKKIINKAFILILVKGDDKAKKS